MKKIFIICLFLTGFTVSSGFTISSASVEYAPDNMGCSFYIPPDWKIDYTSDKAVLLSDSLDEDVRIEIYKYLLESNQQIGSEEELIVAVRGLYEEIGIDISPEAKIICTFDDSLVFFETDFIDSATSESNIYRVIIRGVLGRIADNGQVLYLIKAVTPQASYELSEADINLLLHSFRFTEPLAEEFFVRTDLAPYLLMLLIFMLTAFFYARNRRVQKSKNPLGRNSRNFWRCPKCRLVNHIQSRSCHRCGWQNQTVQAPQK